MAEIKTPLIRLTEGEPYIAGPDEVVITEAHSIADIVRYAVECSSVDEVRYLVEEMKDGE
jgi:hypothetical protein